MNRRQVFIATIGLVPAIRWNRRVTAQVATPSGSQELPNLPSGTSPIPLTDEVDLLYFRAISQESQVQLLGELRNNADYWVAAPPVVFVSSSGLRAQPRMLHDDIAPRGREQFSNGFFQLTDRERADALEMTVETVDLEFCDFGPGAVVTYNDQMDLRIVVEDQNIDLDRFALRATVEVTNLGDLPTELVTVAALVYDENRYYCGSIASLESDRLRSEESITFELERGFATYSTDGSPLELVNSEPTIVYQAGWIPNVSLSCL